MINRRPQDQESADYFKRYINLVEGENIFPTLETAMAKTIELLSSLSDEKWDYRYAPGKWSIKELMLHVIDTERIFSYRALRIARNDPKNLRGFEQDDYVPFCEADERSPASIIEEYKTVRAASLSLFKNFSDDMWSRMGTVSNNPFSPLAIAFVVAGHEIHHLNVLEERYF